MRTFGISVLLFVFSAVIQADDETRKISGRVVDPEGQPAANVEVATFWNANGISKEEQLAYLKSPDRPIKWQPEGSMEPWGRRIREPVNSTDADGRFSLSVHVDDYKVMALDAKRKRGGIGLLDADDPQASMEIVLQPLVKMHGNLRVVGQDDRPDWTGAIISLPVHERFPLGRDRLAFCGSDRAHFAFLLPPGRYVLHAYNDGGEGRESRNAETISDVTIELNGEDANVDLGDVMLTLQPTLAELAAKSKAEGGSGNYTQRYGQPAPDWHVHYAKGTSKDVQPRDFRGKWLAVYFWGPYCRPCLKRGLPSLIDFDEQHSEERDRFQLVAFCLDKDGGMKSTEDVERLLTPVVKNVWGGKSIEFPILLDNTVETYQRYGLESVGHLVLIDPDGNLIQGDLTTLSAELSMP